MSIYTRPDVTRGGPKKRKEPDSSEPDRTQTRSVQSSNKLLAGCLANEFLARGTLLGAPVGQPSPGQNGSGSGSGPVRSVPAGVEPAPAGPPRAYAEVAYLLKADGAHIPGVVNPTQLARWLQM